MKTRSLTEGAMLGAITVVLTIIGDYLGFPPLIVPVPLVLLVYRHGMKLGMFAAFAAAVVSGLVGGHVFSGVSIIIWGFIGIALGMGLREKFSFPKLMAAGIFATVVVVVLEILLFSLIFGENMLTQMVTMLIQSIEQAMELSQNLGVPTEAMGRYEQLLQVVPFLMKWGLPALLLMLAVGVAFLNLGVARLILKRLGDDSVPWIKPFIQWTLPAYFGLFFLFGMATTLASQAFTLPAPLLFMGVNTFLIVFQAYFVLGLAVVWHYFKTKDVARFLRVLFILFLFTTEITSMLVVFLGVTDNIFDFRKLRELEN